MRAFLTRSMLQGNKQKENKKREMRISMVKKFRRFMTALCIMMLCFTTCAFAAETSTAPAEDLTEYVQYYAQSYAQTYGAASKTELKYMADNSVGVAKDLAEGIYEYAQNDALGAMLSLGKITVTRDGDIYKAVVPVTYEKGDMTMTFDMQYLIEDLRVTDVNVSFKSAAGTKSLGDTMKMAGVNTVIGISIVFCMLAFMSIIIAQFKHVDGIVNKISGVLSKIFAPIKALFTKNKNSETAEEGIDNAVTQIVENEATSVDDLELIAVITAAIAASEDAPSDGFTVRSIRRVRF